jgi:hypothetical protein
MTSMPLTASASRMTRLMSCTSGMSTSPGCLSARQSCTRAAKLAQPRPPTCALAVEPQHEVDVAAHVVVEDGDVAARHVGDGDRVVVLDELVQDARPSRSRRRRVRREADDLALARQLALAADLGARGG